MNATRRVRSERLSRLSRWCTTRICKLSVVAHLLHLSLTAYCCDAGHLFIVSIGQRVGDPARSKKAVIMEFPPETPTGTGICETCAERGRPHEPVYKMGMCEFCYKGLPHPEAPPGQLKRELLGAHARQRLSLSDREQFAAPNADAGQQQKQKPPRERVVDVLVPRNGRGR
jgi:hypothetical protein